MTRLLSLLCLTACASQHKDAEIVIVVDSDFAVPLQIDEIEFYVKRVGAPENLAQKVPVSLGGSLGKKLPLVLGIAPDGNAQASVEVRVEGYKRKADGKTRDLIVRRLARVRFDRGSVLLLRMDLVQSCADKYVMCEKQLYGTCDERGCTSATDPAIHPWTGDNNGHSPFSDAGPGEHDAGPGDGDKDAGHDAGPKEHDAGQPDTPEQLALGRNHSCVRTRLGRVFCWGKNDHGELGDGKANHGATCTLEDKSKVDCSFTPVEAKNLPVASDLSAGDYQTCAVHAPRMNFGGNFSCWGDAPSTHATELAPTAVIFDDVNIADAKDVEVGGSHACLLRENALPLCWGETIDGELGNGKTEFVDLVVEADQLSKVAKPSELKQLAVGQEHSCVLLSSGEIACWGRNDQGQCGQDLAMQPLLTPTKITGLSGMKAVFANGARTCALRSGAFWCVGQDSWGELGNGQMETEAACSQTLCTPTAIAMKTDDVSTAGATSYVGGDYFACVLFSDGKVACMGNNETKQLGPRVATDSANTPKLVFESSARAIAAGASHACAIVDDKVLCWGLNDAGQLGTSADKVKNSAMPLEVPLGL